MDKKIKIELQKATAADISDLLNFELTSNGRLFCSYKNDKEISDYLKRSEIFFILMDGNRVGTISFEKKGESEAEFDGLIVHPDYRGQGIASEAMKLMMEKLNSYRWIYLYTHPENVPSLTIYFKNGFLIKKWVDNRFGDGQPRLYLERKK